MSVSVTDNVIDWANMAVFQSRKKRFFSSKELNLKGRISFLRQYVQNCFLSEHPHFLKLLKYESKSWHTPLHSKCFRHRCSPHKPALTQLTSLLINIFKFLPARYAVSAGSPAVRSPIFRFAPHCSYFLALILIYLQIFFDKSAKYEHVTQGIIEV